jgi:hypothetical protein
MRLHLAHVVVLGGGYVGQLLQLAMPFVRILDWRKRAPEDHLETRMGPQYLWEPIPGVESYSFPVMTLVDGRPPTTDAVLAYKQKIGKEHDGGDWGLQFRHMTTGWHSQLPIPRIEYNRRVISVDLQQHQLLLSDEAVINYDILLNTIPLPAFLNLCVIPPLVVDPFRHDVIYMRKENLGRNVYAGMVLNYLSDPKDRYYRMTTWQGFAFAETLYPVPGDIVRSLMPGKIHTHRDSERVLRDLGVFDTFCFGRFATWRPDELAHQTWTHILEWEGTR